MPLFKSEEDKILGLNGIAPINLNYSVWLGKSKTKFLRKWLGSWNTSQASDTASISSVKTREYDHQHF